MRSCKKRTTNYKPWVQGLYFFWDYKRCELRFLVFCWRVIIRIIQNKVCVCSLYVG
jgi:hypothetical protein